MKPLPLELSAKWRSFFFIVSMRYPMMAPNTRRQARRMMTAMPIG